MNKKTIGLDLGTSNVRIWTREDGIILREPCVISIDKESGKVEKIGAEAKKLLGKSSSYGNETLCPMRNGVIAEVDETVKLIYTLLKQANLQNPFSRPSVLVGIPDCATAVERGAVMDAVYRAGAKSGGVYVVREPIAAAIGAGLPIDKPRGSMLVDIGNGTTEAVILSLDGVVVSNSIPIASSNFDLAIVEYMHSKFDIDIGITTAEKIKIDMGAVTPVAERKNGNLTGLNIKKRMPSKVAIDSVMISEALREQSIAIIKLIKATLQMAPPEICGDIFDSGITLTGGGSMIGGMTQLLSTQLGLKINLAKDPLDCVINGMGKIIENGLEQYIEYDA
ncbi:MAG: rod shape-determining protein [Ruminococcaceae bacterium]|nr:rod shape-determining protein [Oscillospiraceae bacterium]